MSKRVPKTYKSLGELITSRLTELNQSPAEFARQAGMTAQYLGDLASGKKSNPGLDVIEALSTHLQVSKLEILVALQYLPAEVLGDPDEARLLELFRRLPEDKQEVVQVILASLNATYVNGKSNGPVSVAMEHPKRKQRAGKKP